MKEMRASMKIPFVTFKPLEKELDSELRNAFERVYKRSWYIEGIEDENFEKIFAEYCNSKYCVGVGNGLDALYLALRALGIKEGDEVLYGKYSGTELEYDGVKYLMMRQSDVLAVIVK